MIKKPTAVVEYDELAEQYAQINAKRPLNEFATYPSLYKAAGDVNGKDVIDLACGEGLIARGMRERGAKRVIGVDISGEMLKIARQQESESDWPIEYIQGRVGALGKVAEFDVATGGFLLHYAKTREELEKMCMDVVVNLKPGGLFIGLNNNPLHPLSSNAQYQNLIEADPPLEEGNELRVHYTVDDVRVEFKNYYWKKETYETTLKSAGFTNIEWIDVEPTTDGIQQMGEEYWKDFRENPFMVVIRAKKIRT